MSTAQNMLLGAVCGLLAVCGVALMVRGWIPTAADPGQRPSAWQARWQRARAALPEQWSQRYRWLVLAAAVTAIVVWALTTRPVHGLLAAAALLGLPWIWHPGGGTKAQIVQLEALAEWLQQLASVHVAGISLEQAVQASADRAPAQVAAPVRTLTARLRVGWTPQRAYRHFADELADGAADNVVMLFLTHVQDRGEGLSHALQRMAEMTAEEAAAYRKVDADRARVRTSTRWVSLFCLGITAVVLLNPAYSAPYHTAGGQLVLAVLGTAFAAALWWLRRMAAATPPPRLLAPLAGRENGGGRATEEESLVEEAR